MVVVTIMMNSKGITVITHKKEKNLPCFPIS